MGDLDTYILNNHIPPEIPTSPSVMASESLSLQNDSDFGDNITQASSDVDVAGFWSSAILSNLRQNEVWSLVLIIAYSIVFLVGMVGNMLVLLVIIFKPPLHPVTSIFLFNLAVADLLVIIFCVPGTLMSNLFIPWILGLFMCKGMTYVQGVSVCASAYSLAAFSLDRCKAIGHPIERYQGQGITSFQAVATSILIWTCSIIITLPWLFTFELREEDGHIYCLEVWESEFLGKLYFLVVHLTCCFAIPFFLILFCNVKIMRSVSKSSNPPNFQSLRGRPLKKRESLWKTLGAVTAAFVICWLPLYLLVTYIKFSPNKGRGEWEENVLSVLVPILQWLGSVNSCLNPVLYAFINARFRRAIRSFLSTVSK